MTKKDYKYRITLEMDQFDADSLRYVIGAIIAPTKDYPFLDELWKQISAITQKQVRQSEQELLLPKPEAFHQNEKNG